MLREPLTSKGLGTHKSVQDGSLIQANNWANAAQQGYRGI